ncbi:hypothetical protein EOA19_32210, partial [Mesorhizobium sp. M7A.F.Ca.US.010.02.1.1]
MAKLPISPPCGGDARQGRGGAVPPTCQLIVAVPSVFGWVTDAESSDPSHPPLSCRTSPPQGGVWTGDIANRCARTSRTVWRALRREVRDAIWEHQRDGWEVGVC